MPDPRLHAQGFITSDGTRKLLVINKSATSMTVALPSQDEAVRLTPYAVEVFPY
jgi:hypothetical protein